MKAAFYDKDRNKISDDIELDRQPAFVMFLDENNRMIAYPVTMLAEPADWKFVTSGERPKELWT